MWILDGAACWLLPQLLREAYRARAAQDDRAMRRRGTYLIGGGLAGIAAVAVLL